jgi:hypothetical protein
MPSKASFAQNYRSPIVTIEYTRGVSPKIPVDFSEELCWILGLLHGDGIMSGGRILFCDLDESFHKEATHKLFKRVFGVQLNLFHDVRRNSFYSHVKNKQLYAFLTRVLQMPAGAVRSQLRIPKYFDKFPMRFQAAYLAGLFDAEGCVTITAS